ncbi:MAG: DinB family protein [Jiangellaceae bacterium]
MNRQPTALTGLAADLHRYLQQSRESVVSSLDGLAEYDIRRPMTPSATNLLGLIKHLAGVELGYLGDSVGRPSPVPLPWDDESIWDSADMWATAEETRDDMVTLYRAAWQHSDQSIDQLGLDAPAQVSWWPEERRHTTLGSLLVRIVAETAQHAGHADIIREMIDGRAGRDHDEVGDAEWWARHLERVQHAADQHRGPTQVVERADDRGEA